MPVSHQYLHVMAMQNGRVDLLRELPFSGFGGDKLLYRFSEANVFAGGNCFRYFDISNIRTTMYNVQRIEQYGGELFAFLKHRSVAGDRDRHIFRNIIPVITVMAAMVGCNDHAVFRRQEGYDIHNTGCRGPHTFQIFP